MEPIKCQCGDCGKEFNLGDEGDNERFCLRCEFLECGADEGDNE